MKTDMRAKKALWSRFKELTGNTHDPEGYLANPTMNLLKGVNAELIETDYRQGSGSEWDTKFRAIHSSSALVANTFGRWKTDSKHLKILGLSNFSPPYLEKKCPTGLKGTPPNLDVVIESETDIVGIESKLLEPLTQKQPKFSENYKKLSLPRCEEQWWQLLESSKSWRPSHFDVAQIIKHYLGLRNKYRDGRQIHLVYIYWQPLNASGFQEYEMHQKEIELTASFLDGSEVDFVAMNYHQLWDSWAKDPMLEIHAGNLKQRYAVDI